METVIALAPNLFYGTTIAVNIEKIMQLFAGKEDKEYIAKSVDKDKIAEENYNLSVSIYVEIKDTREAIDIKALNAEIKKQ